MEELCLIWLDSIKLQLLSHMYILNTFSDEPRPVHECLYIFSSKGRKTQKNNRKNVCNGGYM